MKKDIEKVFNTNIPLIFVSSRTKEGIKNIKLFVNQ